MAVSGDLIGAGISVGSDVILAGIGSENEKKKSAAIAEAQREANAIATALFVSKSKTTSKAIANLQEEKIRQRKILVFSLLGLAGIATIVFTIKKLQS